MLSFLDKNKKFWEAQSTKFIENYNGGKVIPGLSKLERELAKQLKGNVLHPFCNFGMNTFSLEHYSKTITGVDFSKPAIDFANEYSINHNLNSKFIHSDFFEFNPSDTFDSIFMSYGILDWVYDLNAFFNKLYYLLKDSGKIYMIEYHSNFYKELIHEKNATHIKDNIYEFSLDLNQYKISNVKSIYGEGRELINTKTNANIFLHDTNEFIDKISSYNFKIDFLEYSDFLEFPQSEKDIKIDKNKYIKGEIKDDNPMLFSIIISKK